LSNLEKVLQITPNPNIVYLENYLKIISKELLANYQIIDPIRIGNNWISCYTPKITDSGEFHILYSKVKDTLDLQNITIVLENNNITYEFVNK
jgi:hypothetical protein